MNKTTVLMMGKSNKAGITFRKKRKIRPGLSFAIQKLGKFFNDMEEDGGQKIVFVDSIEKKNHMN